jgi:hypothetical protein
MEIFNEPFMVDTKLFVLVGDPNFEELLVQSAMHLLLRFLSTMSP